jgi:hypothetical protein
LLALLPGADVLDLAEIAVALQSLPQALRVNDELGKWPAVERRYQIVHRAGWTEALLSAGEEPPDPTVSSVGASPLPRGAEVAVTLSIEVGNGGLHCVRDPLPAGVAPIGLPSSAVHDGSLLLCGEPRDGKLSLGYSVRALHAGRFRAPPATAGVLDVVPTALSPSVMEVAP